MGDDALADRLQVLGMLASALAGRAVAVTGLSPGEPAWTDGQLIYVDADADPLVQLKAVAVQASMIAAGSLDPDVVGALVRHRKLAKRYLTVEGHRALAANAPLLPNVLVSLGDRDIGGRSDSPHESLAIAASRQALEDPAPEFGVIRAAKVIAACARMAKQDEEAKPGHVPRRNGATGTRGARRRRDGRLRRPRLVHQPGWRGRIHRQVVEEDAVRGAKDRKRRRPARRR